MFIRTIERLLVPSNTKTADYEITVVYTDQQVKGILGAVFTWISILAVPPIERKSPLTFLVNVINNDIFAFRDKLLYSAKSVDVSMS